MVKYVATCIIERGLIKKLIIGTYSEFHFEPSGVSSVGKLLCEFGDGAVNWNETFAFILFRQIPRRVYF